MRARYPETMVRTINRSTEYYNQFKLRQLPTRTDIGTMIFPGFEFFPETYPFRLEVLKTREPPGDYYSGLYILKNEPTKGL